MRCNELQNHYLLCDKVSLLYHNNDYVERILPLLKYVLAVLSAFTESEKR